MNYVYYQKYKKYKKLYLLDKITDINIHYNINGGTYNNIHEYGYNKHNVILINLDDITCVPFDYKKMYEYYLLHGYRHEHEYEHGQKNNKNYNKNSYKNIIYKKMHDDWNHIYKPYDFNLIVNAESNMGNNYNTSYKARLIIKETIKELIPDTETLTIMDANSNIGMDALSFCTYFGHVICIEKEPDAVCALAHNIKNFTGNTGNTGNNVRVYSGSCLDFIDNSNLIHDINVIYFDSPWGGKLWNTYDMLNLDGIFMDEIIIKCFTKIKDLKAIFLKHPKHYGKYKFINKKIINDFNESLKKLNCGNIIFKKHVISYTDIKPVTYYLFSFIINI